MSERLFMIEEIKSMSKIVRSLTSEAMEGYRHRMLHLLEKEKIKSIWDNICNMTEDEITHELRGQCVSVKGTFQVLKERLFRSRLRMLFGDKMTVLWLEKYDAAEAKKVFIIEALAPLSEEEETVVEPGDVESVQEENLGNATAYVHILGSQDEASGVDRGNNMATQTTPRNVDCCEISTATTNVSSYVVSGTDTRGGTVVTTGTAVTWALSENGIKTPVCVPSTWGLMQSVPRVTFASVSTTEPTLCYGSEYRLWPGVSRANEKSVPAMSDEEVRAQFRKS